MERIKFTEEEKQRIQQINQHATKIKKNKSALSNFMAELSPEDRELMSRWICSRLVGCS